MSDEKNTRPLWDCKTSSFSAYYEGAFDLDFWKNHNCVVINARTGGEGHFAIRKPVRRIFGKLYPRRWVMWKNDREKLYELRFRDSSRSIEIDADMKNPSCRKLKFKKDTYQDLKEHIPVFLAEVGYVFQTHEEEDVTVLTF